MTHPDIELDQLRLIDEFLEDGDDTVADDAFDYEFEQAIVKVRNSKLRRLRTGLESEKNIAWAASLRNARLLAKESDRF